MKGNTHLPVFNGRYPELPVSLRALTFLSLWILLTGPAAIASGANSSDFILPATLNVAAVSSLEITSFSASNSNLVIGDTIDFIVTLRNQGNTITGFETRVYIYDPGNQPVEALVYANATIAAGETQTLTKSWSTSRLSRGTYAALANATYNGSVTSTPDLSITVNLAPPPSPSEVTTTKKRKPVTLVVSPSAPALTPPELLGGRSLLELLTYPVLREVASGENTLLFPQVRNVGPTAIEVGVEPFGPGAALSDPTSSFLARSETASLAVPLQMPSDIPPGYYTFILNLSANRSAAAYLPMIVRLLPPPRGTEPHVYRDLSVDVLNARLSVTLNVYNHGSEPLPYVQVYEKVPAALLPPDIRDILFVTVPAHLYPEQSMVRWDLTNVLPGEKRSIVYQLPLVPSDISAYINWPVAQVTVIRPATEKIILLADAKTPSLLPGESGILQVRLFNAGPAPQKVNIDLLGPAGWSSAPQTLSVVIPPREPYDLSFSIGAPVGAEAASYAFNLRLDYADMLDDRSLFVTVNPSIIPAIAILPPPLREQLASWAFAHWPQLAFASLAAGVVSFFIFMGHRFIRMPKYNPERVESVIQLGRFFKPPKP